MRAVGPPADDVVDFAASIVRRYVDDASTKLRLPMPGEQFAIDVVDAWTNARHSAEVIPFVKWRA